MGEISQSGSVLNTYPYTIPYSFLYRVVIAGVTTSENNGEGIFHEVSGLRKSMMSEPFYEGGVNDGVFKFPSKVTYDNLILKRGYLIGSSMTTWIDNSLNSFPIKPAGVTISLLSPDGSTLAGWQLKDAYPVSLKFSDLNSMENSLFFETFELAYSKFENI